MVETLEKVDNVLEKKRENIINNEAKLHETFSVGDVAMQGDVILVCISKLPKGARPRANRQLADGVTQGSRHIVARGEVFDCNTFEVAELIQKATGKQIDPNFVGPVFVSPADPTKNDLTHPEHGHHGFPAFSVIASVHQRTLDSQRRIQRVHD